MSAQSLVDLVESKVSTQIVHAGFRLQVAQGDLDKADVSVDRDAFSQIFINLVDNAIKFSDSANNKTIELAAHCSSNRAVVFSVRDFGPGIAKDQLKKIFKLFYRPESELTRETLGTGIGLALVHQLVSAMNGKVDVTNHDPGAQFRVTIPQVLASASRLRLRPVSIDFTRFSRVSQLTRITAMTCSAASSMVMPERVS